MTNAPRNETGAGPRDLEIAVEHRHRDLLLVILLQPAEHVEQPADVEVHEEADLQGEAERVLVVVEEAGQLSLLVDTLDSWGYQAHASQSGTAALQWIEAQGVPDLVVLDADMNLFTGVRTLAALFDHGYRRAVILLALIRIVKTA